MTGADGADRTKEPPASGEERPDSSTLTASTVAYLVTSKVGTSNPAQADNERPPGDSSSQGTRAFSRVELTESGVLRRPTPPQPLGDDLVRRLSHNYRLTQIGTLAAGVAHDISNPVTFVYANLVVMQDCVETLTTAHRLLMQATRPGPPERHAAIARQLEVLDAEGCLNELSEMCSQNLSGMEQITELVGALKSFARERHDDGQVALHDVARNTLRLLSKTLQRQATVSVDLRPVPSFSGEATSLSQVVMNLLMNALHAVSQTTGREKRIKISTELSGQDVVLAVDDTGSGMTREVQEHIFEPFYTTKTDGEGTGLGLALCRDIAHRHGGTLRCDSAPDEGSCFELVIPLQRPTDP